MSAKGKGEMPRQGENRRQRQGGVIGRRSGTQRNFRTVTLKG
jgi:hypothetical protein